MSFLRLLIRDFAWHAKSFLRLSLAACLVCMVLTSALLIGDSVRGTLRDQIAHGTSSVKTRLVFSTPITTDMEGRVLHTSGFISAKIKANLYAFPDNTTLSGRDAYCSKALAEVLQLRIDDTFTVRVLSMAPISSEQLMGMPPQLKQIRLVFKGIWKDDHADVNFSNPQQRPLNLLINHDLLTQTLTLEKHAVNEIWSQSEPDVATASIPDDVYWKLSQLKFDRWQNHPILKSDAYFISPNITHAYPEARKGLITFAQSLSDTFGHELNYFFVGAFEGDLLPVQTNNLLISQHINKQLTEPVKLTSYVINSDRQIGLQSHQLPHLSTIDDSEITSRISPEVPGLTDSDDCTQWITGMPIDLDKVDEADKAYWNTYQSKPKVYMNFEQAQAIFAPGQCTLLIFDTNTKMHTIKQQILPVLRNDPLLVQSIAVGNIQEQNLQQGIDFAPLFLGLSLFIIISGLLILWMLLKLHLQSRNEERQLLRTYVGSDRQIRRLLSCEIMLAIFPGILLGLAAGVVLCKLQLSLLIHLWNEIIGMDVLNFHARWQSFAIALTSSVISCWLLLTISLRIPAKTARYNMPKSQYISTAVKLGTLSFRRRFREYRVCMILLTLGFLGTLGVGGFGIKVRGEDGFSYQYVAQTAVPVVPSYDSPFPPGGLAVRVYQADRADCANLLRASQPTVYGCDVQALTGDQDYLQPSHAAVDSGSLQWIIKRKIGDRLTYPKGQIKLQRAMKASVFQRGILVNQETFKNLFPKVEGAQFFLIKDQQSVSAYRAYLEPYGGTVQSVDAFMAEAESIQNRYLAIFLQLGLLGFLLGIGSLVLMILNQLNAQDREIVFMYETGLPSICISHMFLIENVWIYAVSSAISLMLLFILVLVCNIHLTVILIGWGALFLIGLILIYCTIKQYFRKFDQSRLDESNT